MFRSVEQWEALEAAAARSLASVREKLPALGAAAFVLALITFYGYWPQISVFLERVF